MSARQSKVESYGLSKEFEQAVVLHSCAHGMFYDRIGHAVDHEAVADERGKLAMQACHAVAKDLGHGPCTTTLVIQRLCRWRQDGKVTNEQIVAVDDYFTEAESARPMPVESAILELVPILKRRAQARAVESAMDEYAKKGDFASVLNILSDADRLGGVDVSVGSKVDGASFEQIERVRMMKRLPTGIADLDVMLDGGLWRGALGTVMGSTGEGKSLFLSHVAAEATLSGLLSVYATLELPVAFIQARLIANLTGVPTNAIIEGGPRMLHAKDRLVAMRVSGTCYVKDFTPRVTTVDGIKEWVTRVEQTEGRAVDLVIVDYGDLLGAPTKDGKDVGDYKLGGVVFESLYVYSVETNKWVWTAVQKRRQADKGNSKKKADTDDVADSIQKVRKSDMVISLNARGEFNEELLFHVAKNRLGNAHVSVGPLAHDFACGRMVMLSR